MFNKTREIRGTRPELLSHRHVPFFMVVSPHMLEPAQGRPLTPSLRWLRLFRDRTPQLLKHSAETQETPEP